MTPAWPGLALQVGLIPVPLHESWARAPVEGQVFDALFNFSGADRTVYSPQLWVFAGKSRKRLPVGISIIRS
jgi:hypothetical protein